MSARRRSCSCSRTAARRRAGRRPSRSGSRRPRRMSRSPRSPSARPTASSHQKIAGGYTEQIAVPVESTTLRTIAQASGGHVVTTFDPAFPDGIVTGLGTQGGPRAEGRRGDVGGCGRRDGADAGRRVPRRRLVPEGAVKAAAGSGLRRALPSPPSGRRSAARRTSARASGTAFACPARGWSSRPAGAPSTCSRARTARASSPGSTRRRRRATFA